MFSGHYISSSLKIVNTISINIFCLFTMAPMASSIAEKEEPPVKTPVATIQLSNLHRTGCS